MNAEAMKSLEEGLYRKFSTGASVIILEMGFSYGSMLYDQLDKKSKLGPEAEPLSFRLIMQILFKDGLGKITATGDTDSGKLLLFKVANCAFCDAKISDVNCNFLRGILAAMMTGLYRRPYKSSIKCFILDGAHSCEIELVGK